MRTHLGVVTIVSFLTLAPLARSQDATSFASSSMGMFLFSDVAYKDGVISGTITNMTVADWPSKLTVRLAMKSSRRIPAKIVIDGDLAASASKQFRAVPALVIAGSIPNEASIEFDEIDESESGLPALTHLFTLIANDTPVASDHRCLSDVIAAAKLGGIDGRKRLAEANALGCIWYPGKMSRVRIMERDGPDAHVVINGRAGWARMSELILSPEDALKFGDKREPPKRATAK